MSTALDAAKIPAGPYCYASHDPMDEHGIIKLNGMCPYRSRRPDGRAHCDYMNDADELGLLDDQVKICGVNDEWDASAGAVPKGDARV